MAIKKQTVEYIASIEHLDQPLTVVSIKGWLFLLFSIILSLCVIVWAFIGTIPITVAGTGILLDQSSLSAQTPANTATLKIYGFIPFTSAGAIHPGMEAKCALIEVDTSIYGMLRGVVKEVGHYPVSLSDPIMQEIPSESLRAYLISGPVPSQLVIIEPILDPHTVSGLAWTSQDGPPIHVESGMVGSINVTLEKVKPISYVIPSIRKKQ